MGKILLKNIVKEGVVSDILIDGNTIAGIYPAATMTFGEDVSVVDCGGKTAIPGFVNMHTHAGMSMMRGIGEDIAFHEWIARIWEVESKVDQEWVYHATKVACLEMIKTGTTTFNDDYWHMPMAHKAAMELGIRPVLAYVFLDKNDPEEAERQKIQCQEVYDEAKKWNDHSTFTIAIHAIYSVSEEMIVWSTEFARKHGLKIHIHLSETQPVDIVRNRSLII